MTKSIALIGSEGRMGCAFRSYCEETGEFAISAMADAEDPLDPVLESQADVVLDLSVGPAVEQHGLKIVAARLPYVIGATGIGAAAVEGLRQAADDSGTPVLLVPNFSLGANLMIRFAALAGAHMLSPTVIERHHAGKADAPSGTARYTAERIASNRNQAIGQNSTTASFTEQLPGSLGADIDGVAIHSVRGGGYLAEQQVSFNLPGETLLIEHRSIDRSCFMPGIAYALKRVTELTGFHLGLDSILELKDGTR
jgi:4-hydroxy-tetrahydrodipicolinate reductase